MNLLIFLTRVISVVIGFCMVAGVVILVFVWLWWLILPLMALGLGIKLIEWAIG